ncbi:hypothetical protein [Bacillus wiedmannii]|nr:hypothetical protein [Bacillus wiedmannii]
MKKNKKLSAKGHDNGKISLEILNEKLLEIIKKSSPVQTSIR